MVFGSGVTTTTYDPTGVAVTAGTSRGIVDASDKLLDITSTNADAIKGYDLFVLPAINSTTTGYVLSNGSKTNTGGLQRKVTAASYEYPIGTSLNKYNPVRLNFSSVAANSSVKGKFNDVTGSFGTVNYYYPQFPLSPSAPYQADNDGFNYYFANNTCNGGAQQWLIIEDGGVTDHGYWSFEGNGTNTSYNYNLEVYPTNYVDNGTATDLTRAIKHSGIAYNANASATDWSPEILSSVSTDRKSVV